MTGAVLEERADQPITATKRADLQGLRAVAVALVVAEHASGSPVGGFLGVDVFFVLSGFLITSALLREHRRTGTISFPAFVRRRVKRLAPAAVLVLASTALLARATLNPVRADGVVADVPYVVLSIFNWVLAARGTDYFAAQAAPSPLQHFWSLGVEEQFYLVWPLLLIVTLGVGARSSVRRARAVAAAALVAILVASLLWGWRETATTPSAAYFSTASRAWELGAGGLVAFVLPVLRATPRNLAAVLAGAGVSGILVSAASVHAGQGVPVPAAGLVVGSTALVVAFGGRAPARLLLPLNHPIASWLGDRSYSLYLWHFPVIVLLGPIVGLPQPVGVAAVVSLSLVLAAVTYALVEEPLLHSPWLVRAPAAGPRGVSWRHWRRAVAGTYRRGGGALLVVSTVTVCVAALWPAAPPATAPLAVPPGTGTRGVASGPQAPGAAPDDGPEIQGLQAGLRDALRATSWPALDPSLDDVLAGRAGAGGLLRCGAADAEGLDQGDCSWGDPGSPTRVLLVGDSTAVHYLPSLVGLVEDQGRPWRLLSRTRFACPFLDVAVHTDVADAAAACRAHVDETVAQLDELAPDVVVIVNSYQALVDDDTGRDVTPERWGEGTAWAVDQVTSHGARAVVLTPPPDEADIEVCYRPGAGPADCITRTPPTWSRRAEADRAASEGRGQTFVDGRPLVCVDDLCPAFEGTTPVKQDAVHLVPAYARKVAGPLGELLTAAGVP